MKKLLLALVLMVGATLSYGCNKSENKDSHTNIESPSLPSKLWNISLGESVDSVIDMLESKHISYNRGLDTGDFFSITANGDISFENTLFDRAHIYFNLNGCGGIIMIKEFENKNDALNLYKAISSRYGRVLKPLAAPIVKSDYLASDIYKESSKQLKVILDSTTEYINVNPIIEVPLYDVSVCLIDTLQIK